MRLNIAFYRKRRWRHRYSYRICFLHRTRLKRSKFTGTLCPTKCFLNGLSAPLQQQKITVLSSIPVQQYPTSSKGTKGYSYLGLTYRFSRIPSLFFAYTRYRSCTLKNIKNSKALPAAKKYNEKLLVYRNSNKFIFVSFDFWEDGKVLCYPGGTTDL